MMKSPVQFKIGVILCMFNNSGCDNRRRDQISLFDSRFQILDLHQAKYSRLYTNVVEMGFDVTERGIIG